RSGSKFGAGHNRTAAQGGEFYFWRGFVAADIEPDARGTCNRRAGKSCIAALLIESPSLRRFADAGVAAQASRQLDAYFVDRRTVIDIHADEQTEAEFSALAIGDVQLRGAKRLSQANERSDREREAHSYGPLPANCTMAVCDCSRST